MRSTELETIVGDPNTTREPGTRHKAIPANEINKVRVGVDSGRTAHRIRSLLARFRLHANKINDGPQHWALFEAEAQSLRGVIGIPTRGCSYARTDWVGCSVCGHGSSTLWDATINHNAILDDVYRSLSGLARHRPPTVCLYTSGSFLDDSELPAETRLEILQAVNSLSWVRSIVIESIPQFITGARLDQLIKDVPNRSISIGIGLDSFDDFVRYFCFQRHFPIKQYRMAVQECKKREIRTTAYLVHKPPFLSTEEAVSDTAESILGAFSLGFDSVSIEPVAMQAGTLQSFLRSQDFYAPPSLWSVASSLAMIHRELLEMPKLSEQIYMGGQVFTPLPGDTLKACDSCLIPIRSRLDFLPDHFFNGLPLMAHGDACEQQFIRGCKVDPLAVISRTNAILDQVESSKGVPSTNTKALPIFSP